MFELKDLVQNRSIAVLILSVAFITWGIFPCISIVLIGLTAKPLGLAFQAISEMTDETSKLTVEIDEQYNACLCLDDRIVPTEDISAYVEEPLWKVRQLAALITIFMIFAAINIVCACATIVAYLYKDGPAVDDGYTKMPNSE